LELLPLRCYLNQDSLRFIPQFLQKDWWRRCFVWCWWGWRRIRWWDCWHILWVIQIRPCKVKVDYQPENMDIHSFREGHYIELLNIFNLKIWIFTHFVKVTTLSSWTSALWTKWSSHFSRLKWRTLLDGVLYSANCQVAGSKIFARHKPTSWASPFQPISNLGDPLFDLAMVLIVPEGNITAYFRGVVSGTTIFAG
jgi:hypothetical protein